MIMFDYKWRAKVPLADIGHRCYPSEGGYLLMLITRMNVGLKKRARTDEDRRRIFGYSLRRAVLSKCKHLEGREESRLGVKWSWRLAWSHIINYFCNQVSVA